MRVLLVDDETEFVATLAERLSFRNIEVDFATKGADALVLAEKKAYDLAILDMKMPGISGIELKGLLEKQSPKMKFIFLTGHGSEEDYTAGASEACCYLIKPVSIDILLAKIKKATES
jgi:DNA-binding response OmpR family regulator